MAFALRKNESDFDAAPMSDMNVTPLVDVMLVLLIVFMVAAPLMAQGVPINLPKVQTKPLSDQKPPIGVSVDAAGQYYVDTKPVAPRQLVATLDAEDPTKDPPHPCSRRREPGLRQGRRSDGLDQQRGLHQGRPRLAAAGYRGDGSDAASTAPIAGATVPAVATPKP